MRDVKLSGAGSGAAPHLRALAFGRVFENSRVAVAVRNEQPAVRTKRQIRCSAQGRESAFIADGDLANVDLLKLLALRRKFQNRGASRIYGPDIAIAIDTYAMRDGEHPFAPGAQRLAFLVHGDHGIGFIAALENVDDPAAVDRH